MIPYPKIVSMYVATCCSEDLQHRYNDDCPAKWTRQRCCGRKYDMPCKGILRIYNDKRGRVIEDVRTTDWVENGFFMCASPCKTIPCMIKYK